MVRRHMCTVLTRLKQRGYHPGRTRDHLVVVVARRLHHPLVALLLAALFHILGWTCEALLHQLEAAILNITALAAYPREDSCG